MCCVDPPDELASSEEGVGADIAAGVVAFARTSRGDVLTPFSLSLFSRSRSRSLSLATASTYPPTSLATSLKSLVFDSVSARKECSDSDVGEVRIAGRCASGATSGMSRWPSERSDSDGSAGATCGEG